MAGPFGKMPPSLLTGLPLRVFSAIIMIPAAIAAVWFGGPVFVLMIGVAALIMVYEWSRMIEGDETKRVAIGLAITAIGSIGFSAFGYYEYAYILALVGGALIWFGFSRQRMPTWWRGVGVLYIIMPCIALIWLRAEPESGRMLTFMVFLVVWATDIGAYGFGRWIGGPKLNPQISPQKTWAGAVGGILAGGSIAAVLGGVAFRPEVIVICFFLGLALGIASAVGDFAESAMKRGFGVKDTSGFIPGHGGVLDRLDGMIFATVVMAIAMYLVRIYGN